MSTLLKLSDVRLETKQKVRLKNIELKINRGEKIALLGENGSGKTSLIQVANGCITPTQGTVEWKGISISKLKARQRLEISTVWQDLKLIDGLSVGQTINMGALGRHNIIWAIFNLLIGLEEKECLDCLNCVGLPTHLVRRQITTLSGGQKQRVAIAKALRQYSELLLADEPLASLDPSLIDKIIKLLTAKGTLNPISLPATCLISLHRTDLTKYFSRVIGLKHGEIIFDLPSEEVHSQLFKKLYSLR